MIKESFKPTAAKVAGIIVIFALTMTYAFVPTLTNPLACTINCSIEIGYPLKFLFFDYGIGTLSFNNFIFVNFIINFMIFYFGLCLISLILNIGRRKNVPNSDSGRRDSGPAQKAGV